MNIFEKYEEIEAREFNERIRLEVRKLRERGNVSREEWNQPMNSYERKHLIPALDTRTLIEATKHCCKNIWTSEDIYEGALAKQYVPVLIQRLEALLDKNDQS